MRPRAPGPGPRLTVEAVARRAGRAPGEWLVTWRLQNVAGARLELRAARLPHGRFRAAERDLAPPPRLPAGGRVEIELPVACAEPPGAVVDNAFLILRVRAGGAPWRVFARLRVEIDPSGAPRIACQAITSQPIGFSA